MKENTMIIVVLIAITIFSMISSAYYNALYQESIKQGAKNVVTALEMVVACQQVGNITQEQITAQYINTFILNKTK